MRLGVFIVNYSSAKNGAGCPKEEEEKDIQIPEPAGICRGGQLVIPWNFIRSVFPLNSN